MSKPKKPSKPRAGTKPQISEKKPRKAKTKVKAHWRKVDPKKLQQATIERAMKGKTVEEPPLPDDPEDEIDQRTSTMAVGLEEVEKKQRTYTRKLTPAKVRAALKETGGIILQAAEVCGVARVSLYQYIERHPDIKQYMEELREEILDAAQSTILLAIMGGNIEVAKWYLTRMGAKRGFVDKVQQVDAVGNPYDLRQSIVASRPVLSPDGPRPATPIL